MRERDCIRLCGSWLVLTRAVAARSCELMVVVCVKGVSGLVRLLVLFNSPTRVQLLNGGLSGTYDD